MVKSPPVNAGEVVSVPGSGKKDPLEEKMASHFNILDYKVPWTEEPGGLHGSQKSDMAEKLSTQANCWYYV